MTHAHATFAFKSKVLIKPAPNRNSSKLLISFSLKYFAKIYKAITHGSIAYSSVKLPPSKYRPKSEKVIKTDKTEAHLEKNTLHNLYETISVVDKKIHSISQMPCLPISCNPKAFKRYSKGPL